MNKLNQYMKSAVFAAVTTLPVLTFAADDAGAAMTEAATKIGALGAGILAIGAAIIGITVTMKGYDVGKRIINKL